MKTFVEQAFVLVLLFGGILAGLIFYRTYERQRDAAAISALADVEGAVALFCDRWRGAYPTCQQNCTRHLTNHPRLGQSAYSALQACTVLEMYSGGRGLIRCDLDGDGDYWMARFGCARVAVYLFDKTGDDF